MFQQTSSLLFRFLKIKLVDRNNIFKLQSVQKMSVVPATKCNLSNPRLFIPRLEVSMQSPDREAGSVGSPGNGISSSRYCCWLVQK